MEGVEKKEEPAVYLTWTGCWFLLRSVWLWACSSDSWSSACRFLISRVLLYVIAVRSIFHWSALCALGRSEFGSLFYFCVRWPSLIERMSALDWFSWAVPKLVLSGNVPCTLSPTPTKCNWASFFIWFRADVRRFSFYPVARYFPAGYSLKDFPWFFWVSVGFSGFYCVVDFFRDVLTAPSDNGAWAKARDLYHGCRHGGRVARYE